MLFFIINLLPEYVDTFFPQHIKISGLCLQCAWGCSFPDPGLKNRFVCLRMVEWKRNLKHSAWRKTFSFLTHVTFLTNNSHRFVGFCRHWVNTGSCSWCSKVVSSSVVYLQHRSGLKMGCWPFHSHDLWWMGNFFLFLMCLFDTLTPGEFRSGCRLREPSRSQWSCVAVHSLGSGFSRLSLVIYWELCAAQGVCESSFDTFL